MFRNLSIAALLILALAAFSGCKKGNTDLLNPDLPNGSEGGLCFEDDTCEEGLVCEEGFCLTAVAGEAGAACLEDGSCNEGLLCEDDVCVEPIGAGEEGGACFEDGTCNEGLSCSNDVCAELNLQIRVPITINRINLPVIKLMSCPAGMVLVKGGTFEMGSSGRAVTLSSYCMDRAEFTNGDKDAAVFAGYLWPSEVVNFSGDHQPLIDVTWNEANVLCGLQGKRLPTEAEWEYAAKGGKDDEYGTVDGTLTDTNACWKRTTNTCDVGTFGANPFGLYDMAGNVSEWVHDWYDTYPTAAATDPTGPDAGTSKIFRGGAWIFGFEFLLRTERRDGFDPSFHSNSVGFRCVADPID